MIVRDIATEKKRKKTNIQSWTGTWVKNGEEKYTSMGFKWKNWLACFRLGVRQKRCKIGGAERGKFPFCNKEHNIVHTLVTKMSSDTEAGRTVSR